MKSIILKGLVLLIIDNIIISEPEVLSWKRKTLKASLKCNISLIQGKKWHLLVVMIKNMGTCSAGKSAHTLRHTAFRHAYIHTYTVINSQTKRKKISVHCTKEKKKYNCDRNDHFTVLKAWLRKTLSQTKFRLALDLKCCHFIHIYIIVILIKSIIAK